MEYHAKSGASSLKIERVMLNLVFGRFCAFFDVFAFLRFLSFVYVEYHAKSGASSLKIERVMLNLVFGRFCHFCAFLTFLRFYVFCVLCI